jgi:hypothetical protein
MGKAARASLLILLLACSAQAGFMPNETPTPPPSQPCVAQEGLMPNETTVGEPTASGVMGRETEISLSQVALELLAVLPSLLY